MANYEDFSSVDIYTHVYWLLKTIYG